MFSSRIIGWLAAWIAAFCIALPALSAEPASRAKFEPAAPVHGALVICGGQRVPAKARARFVELAGGSKARIVVLASLSKDVPTADELLEPWRSAEVGDLQLVDLTQSHQDQLQPDQQATAVLREATAVWITAGDVRAVLAALAGKELQREIVAVLQRGGVVGSDSGAAPALASETVCGENPQAPTIAGLGLLGGVVVDSQFARREPAEPAVRALQAFPGKCGVGIEDGAALVVEGRDITCVGDSFAAVCLSPSETRPARVEVLRDGDSIDLIAMSRAAIARALPAFPPAKPPAPEVARGSLLIVGGGVLPDEVKQRFIELAGGIDRRFVIIPTASSVHQVQPRELEWLAALGAQRVSVFHAASRAEANDPDKLRDLAAADAVWFTGGRQWRLADAYLDTKAHALLLDVLARGGVIGGTSAGASIQGEYLVRGNPRGNTIMMAEGYEHGLNFLPGAAIDQHFAQRNRFADMTELKRAYPQLLGLGIDESTAVVIRGHRLDVLGANHVSLYERSADGNSDPSARLSLSSGACYDLRARKVLSE